MPARTSYAFLWCLMLAWPALAQVVEGTLINASTRAALPGVKVELVQAGKSVYAATTGNRGTFHIQNVNDGVYTARFTLSGFLPYRNANGTPPFQVASGLGPVQVNAEMIPLGKVSGRVIDGRGDAVPDASVELTQPGRFFFLRTDAKGSFNIDQFVLPGSYTLSAAPPPAWKPPEPEGDGPRGWTRTRYPGTVVVPPGGELSNLEIKLGAVAAYAVRGVIFNADGTPASKTTVSLNDGGAPPAIIATSNSEGEFEFPAVVDGEWRLYAQVSIDGIGLHASQWIRIAGHGEEGLKLRLAPPFSIRGRAIVDPAPDSPPRELPPVALTIRGEPGRVMAGSPGVLTGSPGADGHFFIDKVYPGAYRIVPALARPPYYLDSIRVGDREILTEEVEFFPGSPPLTLVYKENGGTVRGTIENCGSGSILLIPRDPALRHPGSLYIQQCGLNDRFEIRAVRPGDYYAVAVSNVPSALYQIDPALDANLTVQASRVNVRAGEAIQVDLRLAHTDY